METPLDYPEYKKEHPEATMKEWNEYTGLIMYRNAKELLENIPEDVTDEEIEEIKADIKVLKDKYEPNT
ncbi:hypothetical protein [Enterococcus faecium]|uniref:hypothetical protein n=1 Tax=Enterococcus faecium TaxID=1352 RepID=UPI000BF0506A|nr:hypothetical protein [Enterococcus faecium]PEH49310.1 hypothetical protein CRM75_16160 [Enterococcus faecium]